MGMLDAWGDHPAVRAVLDEASQALNEDIGALIRDGSKEALALTTNTQPVMLVAGVAAYRVWMAEVGIAPQAVAGHSLGEYAALVAAGALTLADAVPLVRLRGQAMQQAVPVGKGAMAAILGMDPARVAALCAEVAAEFSPESGEVVEAANFNDNAQTVISGSKAAVERACEVLKTQGAKRALLLPVSAPFHCALMQPAARRDCDGTRRHLRLHRGGEGRRGDGGVESEACVHQSRQCAPAEAAAAASVQHGRGSSHCGGAGWRERGARAVV